jgi:hypothetical protein
MPERSLIDFYTSRCVDAMRLWNEARRSAKFEDSLFIWIPKNAGTSVSTLLRQHGMVTMGATRAIRLCFRNAGRVTFGNQSVASLVEDGFVSREFVDRAFKFAIARDPYTRAVSLYRYLSHRIMSNWHEQPSFPDFLQIVADGYYDRVGSYVYIGLSLCNPQVEWLKGAWPDKIYKTENLDEFVTDIGQRWGIEETRMPHLNRSATANVEITGPERALIEKIYAEDFDCFGYRKRKTSIAMS